MPASSSRHAPSAKDSRPSHRQGRGQGPARPVKGFAPGSSKFQSPLSGQGDRNPPTRFCLNFGLPESPPGEEACSVHREASGSRDHQTCPRLRKPGSGPGDPDLGLGTLEDQAEGSWSGTTKASNTWTWLGATACSAWDIDTPRWSRPLPTNHTNADVGQGLPEPGHKPVWPQPWPKSLPGPACSFFCNSGTEAVEGALKLARLATGRTNFVAPRGLPRQVHGGLAVSAALATASPSNP